MADSAQAQRINSDGMEMTAAHNGGGEVSRKTKQHPVCDSTKKPCQFGGIKAFNYGFMRGTHDFCRHPKECRPIYNALSGCAIKCPLGHPDLSGDNP